MSKITKNLIWNDRTFMKLINFCNHEEKSHSVECYDWMRKELNAYDDAIVRATDAKGSLEFAYESGEAKGKLEGKAEGKVATARNLLKLGKLSVEDIAQSTELTIDEVCRLKNTKL
jgi:predicted transposase/invertase (TIGR01784 family)